MLAVQPCCTGAHLLELKPHKAGLHCAHSSIMCLQAPNIVSCKNKSSLPGLVCALPVHFQS